MSRLNKTSHGRSVAERSRERRQSKRQANLVDGIRRMVESLERRLLLSHTFTPSEMTALENGLTHYATWVGDFASQGVYSQRMLGVATTLGQSMDLSNTLLNQLCQPVAAYLNAPGATDVGLGALLDGLSTAVHVGDTFFQFEVNTGVSGLVNSSGKYEYVLEFQAFHTDYSMPLDFGPDAKLDHVKLSPNATIRFDSDTVMTLTFGLEGGQFYIGSTDPNAYHGGMTQLGVTASAYASGGLAFDLTVGLAGVHAHDGQFDLGADVESYMTGKVTDAQLDSKSLTIDHHAGHVNATIPIQATLFGTNLLGSNPAITIATSGGQMFDGGSSFGFNNDAFNLSNFYWEDASDIAPVVQQIASSLGQLGSHSLMGSVTLPFVPTSPLSSELDFGQLFNSVSSQMMSGGSPTFATADQLTTLLANALGVSEASLSPTFTVNGGQGLGDVDLLWHLSLNQNQSSSTSSLDLTGDLAPLKLTSSTGNVSISTSANMDATLGIQLWPTPVTITGAAAMPANGRLSSNSTFQVVIGDGAPQTIHVSASTTNNSFYDLVHDFNVAFLSGCGGRVHADTSGTHLILSTFNSQALRLIVDLHDPLVTQLGFLQDQTVTPDWKTRVFLQNATLGGTASATVSGITASGNLGFLGIGVHDGTGTLNLTASTHLAGPSSSTRVYDSELAQYATSNPSKVAKGMTVTGGAHLSLPVSVSAGFLSLPGGASPAITLDLTQPLNPQIALSYNSDMASLADFANMKASDMTSALSSVGSVLSLADGDSLLTTALPLLGRSGVSLLDLSSLVNSNVSAFSSASISSVQQLGPAIAGAFGLPSGSVTMAMDGHLLRASFTLHASASGSEMMKLDLAKLLSYLPDGNPVKGYLQSLSTLSGSGVSSGVSYSADATLAISAGLDLTDPAHPKPFIDDSTHISLDLSVYAAALAFSATIGPLGVTIKNGRAKIGENTDLNTTDAAHFTIGLQHSGLGRHYLADIDGSAVDVALVGAMAADLPIYFPTPSDSVGSLNITIGDLGDIPGSLSITAPNLYQIGTDLDLPDNMGALLDGIGQLLDHIQAALGSQVLSANLPLVGDKLGKAVDFIGGALRTNIYDKLKAEFDDAIAHGQSVTLQVAQQALYDALGPGGLNILDPLTSYGDYRDITVISDGTGLDTTRIEFKLHLHKDATLVSIPLSFDLGLPALGLKSDGSIQLTAGYDINLWFGVDKTDGFFLDTSNPKEVTLDINAGIPGATLTGTLGFLQVQLTDNNANPTHLGGEFSINLDAPGDELTLTNLGSILDSNFIDPKFDAEAVVDLKLITSIAGIAALPSFQAELLVNWNFSSADPDLTGGVPNVEFKNVRMDVGSFFSSFLSPIFGTIKDITDPIKPILDVLTFHIPGLYDAVPQYGTLIDIAQAFGLVDGGADSIKALAGLADLASSVPTSIENGHFYIDLGSFDLGGANPKSPSFDLSTVLPNVTIEPSSAPSDQMPSEASSFMDASASIDGSSVGVDFPLLDNPKTAFKLLLGQDVNLFTLNIPAVHLGFKAGVSFPIGNVMGIMIELTLQGTLDLQGKVSFGFDTSGLRMFATGHDGEAPFSNPAEILNGFYLSTRANPDGTGQDMPILSATGEVKAGLAADAYVVEVGGEAGIGLTVGASFVDPNNDGKVHMNELAQDIGGGFWKTIKLTGSIYGLFDLYITLHIPIIDIGITWTFFSQHFTIASFDTSTMDPYADRFDPNSKLDSASDLGVGPGQHLTGLGIDNATEQDYFKFSLLKTDDINIVTQSDPGQCNTTTELLDYNHHVIASTAGNGNFQKNLIVDGLAAGSYYLHVVGDGRPGNYNLSIVPASTSQTHIYYVSSPDGTDKPFYTLAPGDNSNDGMSPFAPKATVQSILDTYTLTPADMVVIETGTYDDEVRVGSAVHGATFVGSARGAIYTAKNAWVVNGGSGNRFSNLQFDTQLGGGLGSSIAFNINSGSNNTVDHIQTRGYDYGIRDNGSHDVVDNNSLLAAFGILVDSSAVDSSVTNNNVDSQYLNLDIQGSGTYVYKNTFLPLPTEGDGGTAIDVAGPNSRIIKNVATGMFDGFMIEGSAVNTYISGNTLEGTGGFALPGSHPTGIYLSSGATGAVITANAVNKFADTGILVLAPGAELDSNSVFGNGTGIAVSGSNVIVGPDGSPSQIPNDVSRNSTYGILIQSAASGTTVRGNRVHDNTSVGIQDNGANSLVTLNVVFKNTKGIVSHNVVGGGDWTQANDIYQNQTGIEAGAGALLHFNRVHDNQVGINAASNVQIYNNVLYRNVQQGILDDGSAGVQVRSNTIYLTGGQGLRIQNSASNTTVRDNIFFADGGGCDLYVSNDSQIGLNTDYNNLYRAGAGTVVWFQKYFSDVYDWQIESDMDLHSIGYIAPNPALDNPLFVDLPKNDFHLSPGSTSIDAGDPAAGYALEASPNGNAIDLGAYGDTSQSTPSAVSYIHIDYPNMYLDWEANRAQTIQWHVYNLTGLVRLEVWQEGGPKVANIATVNASSGSYLWSPGQSGIAADPNLRYRIHIVSLAQPSVAASAREYFSVPPYSANYYVNDGSTAGDEYAAAVGNNRNTGRAPSAPKADLLPILRSYALTANETVYVDTGSYIDVRNLVVNYNVDPNKSNPGTGLGNDQGFSIVGPAFHTATLDRVVAYAGTTHLDLDNSSFMNISHLSLASGSTGVLVHNGSRNVNLSNLTVNNSTGDGVYLDSAATDSALDGLYVHDNGGYGIRVLSTVPHVNNSTVSNNARDGIRLDNANGTTLQGNTVYNNQWSGIYVMYAGSQGVLVGSLSLADRAGNIVHDNAQYGIYLGSSAGSAIVAGNSIYNQTGSYMPGIYSDAGNALITLNVVHDSYFGIESQGSGGLIESNRVYNNSHVGIGVGQDNDVRYNTAYGNDIGIEAGGWFGAGYDGTVANNTIWGNASFGILLDGASLGYSGGSPSHPTLLSNTISQPTGPAIRVQNGSNSVEIRNNIISAGGMGISVTSDSQTGFASDYNLFGAGMSALGQWQGHSLTTLRQWQDSIYGDVHSFVANPQFVSLAGGDLHLQSAYGSNHGGSLAPVLGGGNLPTANPGVWTTDGSTSPGIDRGDPTLPFAFEPTPNGGYANLGAESNTAMASQSPLHYALVTSPSDGAVWPEGQTYTIEWRTQDNAGTVTVELLHQGDPAVVRTLAASAPNTGTFNWTLPTDLAPNTDYVVRVTRNDAAGSGTSLSPFTIAPETHDYYVNDAATGDGGWSSVAGEDANDGLFPVSPKGSIRGVLFRYHLGSGDTIHVDAGTYLLTTNIIMDPSASGVTIAGNTNAPAILNRQNNASGSYVFEMAGASNVTLDHLTITGARNGIYSAYNASGPSVLGLIVQNCDIHGNSSGGIYLQSTRSSALRNNRVHTDSGETQSMEISIDGDDNVIQGNEITGLGASSYIGYAMEVYGGRVQVLNNLVHDISQGISVNTRDAADKHASDVSVVSGNTVHDTQGAGISVSANGGAKTNVTNNSVWNSSTTGISAGLIAGSVASGNTVHDNQDGLYVSGSGVTVSSNTAYNNVGAGIKSQGYLTVQSNVAYGNATGIIGSGVIRNNTIYNNTAKGIEVQGNYGLSSGQHPTIINNTIYQPTGDGISAIYSTTNLEIRNNIIQVNAGSAYSIQASSETGFVADYNLVRTIGGGTVANWGSTVFGGLVAWTAALGFDSHSFNADPQFLNVGAGNFHLANTSPSIDAGDPASYYLSEPQPNGNRVNIGADGNTALANPSASPALQVTSPVANQQLQAGQSYAITWQSIGLAAQYPVVFINSGGTATGYWSADAYDSANDGQSISGWTYSNSIDTTGLTRPAPQAVYHSAAYSNFGTQLDYDLPVPNGDYTLRLHFVEPSTYVYPGNRRFDIVVNGVTVQSNYDILATTGAYFKADIRQFNVTASDGNGLHVQLVQTGSVGPIISGLELEALNSGGLADPRFNLDVSLDSGAHWSSIATNVAADFFGSGSFNWTAGPASSGNTAMVRVTSADNGAVAAQSAAFQIAPSGHEYFVNDGSLTGDEYTTVAGNDANNGKTPSTPMANLSALLLAYKPHAGDTIYVDSGTYNLVSNIVLGSDYAGLRIVGPAGHAAVLNRNNTSSSAYVFDIAPGGNNITLDHLAITGAYAGVYAEPGYSGNSTGLTITNDTIFNNFQYGIYLNTGNDSAVISGNTLYGNQSSFYTEQTYGIYVNSLNCTISGNDVSLSYSYGIDVSGAGATVTGNVVHDNRSIGIYMSDGVASNNIVYGQNSNGSSGIYLWYHAKAYGNTVYGNYTGITDGGTGVVASGNRVFANTSVGISAGPAAMTGGNFVYSNPVGILVTGSADPSGGIVGNLVYANSTTAIRISGASLDTYTGNHAVLTNNTIYQPIGNGIEITGQSKGVELRNNIIAIGSGLGYKIDADSTSSLVSDYNLFYVWGSGKVGQIGSAQFTTLDTWFYNTILDDHSRYGEAMFINPAGADGVVGYSGGDHGQDDNFHVESSSPAIDGADPSYGYIQEPLPNGGRMNMGYDGNTQQAATSFARSITVMSPSGHTRYTVGQAVTVNWSSTGLTFQSPVALINAGGPAVGNFGANAYQMTGNDYSLGNPTVDTSGIIDPAPAAVYNSAAYAPSGVGSKLEFDFPVPDGTYSLRLHFVDSIGYGGVRPFDIRINGVTVRAGYDIGGDAGAAYKVVQQTFQATATGGTGLKLELVNDSYNAALVSAIEILRDNSGGSPSSIFTLQSSTDGGLNWTDEATGLTVNHLGNGTTTWTPSTASSNTLLRLISFLGDTRGISQTLVVAPVGHEYYVNDGSTSGDTSPSAVGNNANDGKSPTTPMASLAAILALYHPNAGDTVHLFNGSYPIAVNIPLTSAYNGLVIQGPTTGAAVLNRGIITGGQNVTAVFQMSGAANVTLDHLSITGGDYGVYGADNYSGTNSNHLTVSNSALYGNGSYGLYLGPGNTFAAVTGSVFYGESTGINIGGTDAIVSGNIVHNMTSTGITMSGIRFIVQSNEVYACYNGISDSTGTSSPVNRISGNTVHDNSGYGIYSSTNTTLVIGNTVYGQTAGGAYGIWVSGQATGNTVYGNNNGISVGGNGAVADHNRVFHNANIGIALSNYSKAQGNRVYSNNIGIQGGGYFYGAIEDNLVYANAIEGILLNGAGQSYALLQVNNNTVYQPVGDAVRIQGGSTRISLQNNILQANAGYDVYVAADSQVSTVTMDWNLLVRQNAPASRTGYWGGADRLTLADWQGASGRDAHSVGTTDAKFVNIVGADNVFAYDTVHDIDGGADDNFQLVAGSPAIDRGFSWAGPAADLLGHTRVDDPGTANTGSPMYSVGQLAANMYGTPAVGTLQQSWNNYYPYYPTSYNVTLPFAFPLYGTSYTQVYLSTEGMLHFAGYDSYYSTTNSQAGMLNDVRVAPLWDNLGVGSLYEYYASSSPDQVTFEWRGYSNDPGYSYVSFRAVLFANGNIRFDYGGGTGLSPTSGISMGDGLHAEWSPYDGQSNLSSAKSVLFTLNPTGWTDLGAYEFTGNSSDSTPTVVTGAVPSRVFTGATLTHSTTAITLNFNHALSAVDAGLASLYDLRSAGPDGLFDTPDDVVSTLIPQYTADSTSVTLNIVGGALAPGNYRLTVYGNAPRALHDVNGLALDGNADGTAGGNYLRTFTMGMLNTPPAVTLPTPDPLNEGDTLTLNGSFFDPDLANTWTATVNYGDGSGTVALGINSDNTFTLSHRYDNNGTFNVLVTITDSEGDSGTASVAVSVAEVAPTATFAGSGTVNEGNPASVSFSNASDPSNTDTAAGFRYNYDFNNDGVFEIANSTSATAVVPASMLTNGSAHYTIHGRITSVSDSAYTDYTTSLTVNNVLPGISVTLNGSANSVTPYMASGTFSDPGTGETFTATVDYGDGSGPQPLTLAPDHSFSLVHLYAVGTYQVTVSISDGDTPATATGSVNVIEMGTLSASGIDISAQRAKYFYGPVATFTPWEGTTADQYSAFIAWGDESGSWGTIQVNPDGSGTVYGAKYYYSNGSFDVTTTITGDLAAATVHSTATVTEPTMEISLYGIYPVQGQSWSGYLATVTDPVPNSSTSIYSTTIDWGDGTPTSLGTIYQYWWNLGTLYIYADHTYNACGTYTLNLTMQKSLKGQAPQVVTSTTQVDVMDSPIYGAGQDVSGSALDTTPVIVARFYDTDPAGGAAGQYLATIDWGEGHIADGSIVNDDANPGYFLVMGAPPYQVAGTYTVNTHIVDYVDGVHDATLNVSSTAMIAPADLQVTASTIHLIVGQSFSGQVALFVDPNNDGAKLPGDYQAIILWGDGAQDAGIITQIDANTFAVSGSHTYLSVGTVPLEVQVQTVPVTDPILNGTFEQGDLAGWTSAGDYLPSLYGWGHSGIYSAMVGDSTWNDSFAGVSTLSQSFVVPAGKAQLTFWAYRYSGGYAYLDAYLADSSDIWLQTLWAGYNISDGGWSQYTMDLSQYSGQTVTLGFDVYEAGKAWAGSTWVDDISIGAPMKFGQGSNVASVCAIPIQVSVDSINAVVGTVFDGQVATFFDPNPDGSQSPDDFIATILWGDGQQSPGVIALTSGHTLSVSGTHLYSQGGTLPLQVIIGTIPIVDPVVNGGFEDTTLTGWSLGGDYIPISYPWGHTGSSSILIGDSSWSDSHSGVSIASQDVTLPAGSSTLSFWTHRYSWPGYSDVQSARVLDTSDNVLAVIWSGLWSDNDWTHTSFDMTAFAGQTVRLQFGVSLNGDGMYSYTFLDDVSISRTDKSGVGDGTAKVDDPPIVAASKEATINEGAIFTGSGSFTDPDPDMWTATVDYGDGSGIQGLALSPDKTFSLSHQYIDNGDFTVTVRVNDGTDTGSGSFTVHSLSVAPTGVVGQVGAAVEGSPATFRFSGQSDPSPADMAAGFTYNYSLDGGAFAAGGATYLLSGDRIPDGPSTHTLRGRIIDKDGAATEYALSFNVQNAIPNVTILAAAAISAGGTYSTIGSFSDSGLLDTWSAKVNYGDGGASPTQALALAGTSFSLSHTYASAGVYTVTVWVTDKDGATGSATRLVTVNQIPPQITGITVNDGLDLQRSMVTSITCTFSSVVTLDAGAFTLIRSDGQVVGLSYAAGPASSFVLAFSSGPLDRASLADGRYTFSVLGSKVHLGGTTMSGVATQSITRLFGDADGDGDVDSLDVKAFTLAYTKSKGDPAYRWYFDLDSNNVVDAGDYSAFRLRLNKKV